MTLLKEINNHVNDERVSFESVGHKYWIDNDGTDLTSVTTFIGSFFDKFDNSKAINSILSNKEYNNPGYKYYNMSEEEIREIWRKNSNDASTMGTNLHTDIENFYNNISVKNNSLEFSYFRKFYDEYKNIYEPYRTEWIIFSEVLKITGSIDMVFKNKDGTLTICDWKRSKLINFSSFDNKTFGRFPFNHLQDCNYTHYSLQLNLYKTILEKFYNMKVKDMFLLVLHPSNNSYIKLDVKEMIKESDYLLHIRKLSLEKIGYDNINLDIKYHVDFSEIIRYNIFTDQQIQKKKETDNKLSEKQLEAYNLVMNGKNILLTGEAGSGKSFVIKQIYNSLKYKYNIVITSTTGISASIINGVTLHSYLGIGLGTLDASDLFVKISKNFFMFKRWKDIDILVIDEISMLSCELFDKLEILARSLRQSSLPFGGIQLILSGDFFQLPPVNRNRNDDDITKFCFEAKSWNKCIDNVVNLNFNFRQNEDFIFKKCLNEIRVGKISDETVKILESRVDVELTNEYGILPTKIYSLNVDVDLENEKELNNLLIDDESIEFYQYDMTYESYYQKKNNFVVNIEDKIKKSCNLPLTLQLCKGAQVMLLYNIDVTNKLCNGSRGIVVDFDSELPIVQFLDGKKILINYITLDIEENNKKVLSVTQIPLKVAFATSAHKSQGSTLDYGIVDLSNIFEDGQAYVALSRLRTLDGLCIKNFNKNCIRTNNKVLDFYNKLL